MKHKKGRCCSLRCCRYETGSVWRVVFYVVLGTAVLIAAASMLSCSFISYDVLPVDSKEDLPEPLPEPYLNHLHADVGFHRYQLTDQGGSQCLYYDRDYYDPMNNWKIWLSATYAFYAAGILIGFAMLFSLMETCFKTCTSSRLMISFPLVLAACSQGMTFIVFLSPSLCGNGRVCHLEWGGILGLTAICLVVVSILVLIFTPKPIPLCQQATCRNAVCPCCSIPVSMKFDERDDDDDDDDDVDSDIERPAIVPVAAPIPEHEERGWSEGYASASTINDGPPVGAIAGGAALGGSAIGATNWDEEYARQIEQQENDSLYDSDADDNVVVAEPVDDVQPTVSDDPLDLGDEEPDIPIVGLAPAVVGSRAVPLEVEEFDLGAEQEYNLGAEQEYSSEDDEEIPIAGLAPAESVYGESTDDVQGTTDELMDETQAIVIESEAMMNVAAPAVSRDISMSDATTETASRGLAIAAATGAGVAAVGTAAYMATRRSNDEEEFDDGEYGDEVYDDKVHVDEQYGDEELDIGDEHQLYDDERQDYVVAGNRQVLEEEYDQSFDEEDTEAVLADIDDYEPDLADENLHFAVEEDMPDDEDVHFAVEKMPDDEGSHFADENMPDDKYVAAVAGAAGVTSALGAMDDSDGSDEDPLSDIMSAHCSELTEDDYLSEVIVPLDPRYDQSVATTTAVASSLPPLEDDTIDDVDPLGGVLTHPEEEKYEEVPIYAAGVIDERPSYLEDVRSEGRLSGGNISGTGSSLRDEMSLAGVSVSQTVRTDVTGEFEKLWADGGVEVESSDDEIEL